MCCWVIRQKSQIKIIDETPQAQDYDYLRLKGKMIYKIDSVYEVPKVGIVFEGWYVNSVSLWPKIKKSDSIFWCLSAHLQFHLKFPLLITVGLSMLFFSVKKNVFGTFSPEK